MWAATPSPSRTGSSPTAMRAMRMTAASGRASPAIRPAASASSPTAPSLPMRSSPTRSRTIAARAALILAVHDDPPPGCAAKVIGRETWYDRGALCVCVATMRARYSVSRAIPTRPWTISTRISGHAGRPKPPARNPIPHGRTAKGTEHVPQRWWRRIRGLAAPRRPRNDALNTSETTPRACPECAPGSAARCAPRKTYWPARARSRRRGGGSA